MLKIPSIPILLLLILMCSCNSDSNFEPLLDKQNPDQPKEIPLISPDSETLEMIRKVNDANARITVENMEYLFNEQRALKFLDQIQNLEGLEKLQLQTSYAHEILNAGNSSEAINVLEEVLDELEKFYHQ